MTSECDAGAAQMGFDVPRNIDVKDGARLNDLLEV